MSNPQALVEKHLYELPTCVLEVWAERSPLSEWAERPIAQNLHFHLTLALGQTWFSSGQKIIKGNQTQLGKLIVAVADYIDRYLADDLVTNLTHKLSVPGLARLNLSTLQLFDLVSSLEQCAIAVTILPAVELEVKRITPAWLKVAAIVIATVGISTSAVTLIFRSPTPELVTNSNRDREAVEKSVNSQREPDALSSARPRESTTVSPSPQSKSDLDLQQQTPKQEPTSAAPSISQTPQRESPPNPIIAQSPALETPPPSPQPDKADKVVTSSPTPSAVPEAKPEQTQRDRPSSSISLPRAVTPPPKPLDFENKDENLGRDRQTPNSGAVTSQNGDRDRTQTSKEPLNKPQLKPPSPPTITIIPEQPDRNVRERRQPDVFGYSRTARKQSPTMTTPIAPAPAPVPAPASSTNYYVSHIQVKDIETDLSQDIKASLTKHIQANRIPTDRSGSVIFNITIERGKVVQVQPDREASTWQDNDAIVQIERSLLNWRSPTSTNGKIRLTIWVQKRDR
jgi:hypothetical protein